MNDDVKAALEWLRGVATIDHDGTWPVSSLLAHIGDEPARTTEIVAAATKPLADRIAELERCQRCSREDACFHLCGDCGDEPGVVADLHVAKLRAEDERDALKEELDLMFRVRDSMMTEAAESKAERDTLRARVFEVEQRQVGYVLVSFASHEQWKAELAELGALRARIAELEAQALELCMTIGKAREDNLALVADNEKLTAKIKNKG